METNAGKPILLAETSFARNETEMDIPFEYPVTVTHPYGVIPKEVFFPLVFEELHQPGPASDDVQLLDFGTSWETPEVSQASQRFEKRIRYMKTSENLPNMVHFSSVQSSEYFTGALDTTVGVTACRHPSKPPRRQYQQNRDPLSLSWDRGYISEATKEALPGVGISWTPEQAPYLELNAWVGIPIETATTPQESTVGSYLDGGGGKRKISAQASVESGDSRLCYFTSSEMSSLSEHSLGLPDFLDNFEKS
ncbi:unnamed protein product [Cyprideis torosa]|uniref:Uncharacterized protein n=1 Tax=Cyprideis torosa TaxID=163714 RepID=A0A7R8ZQM0_9CRUS|nr:unnamed protein product [Cyprideis torosa]CAG0901698.1 unnamed protein product [Cyprideis torosa]